MKSRCVWAGLSATMGLAAANGAFAQPGPKVEQLDPSSYRVTVVLPKGTTALQASEATRSTFRSLCPVGAAVSWQTADGADGKLVFVGALHCTDEIPPLPVPPRAPRPQP